MTISGTGITIETVLDIKNQLLALQNEIGLYDPEELRMKDEKIQDLIKVNEDLVKAESKLSSESSKLHEEYEDKMEAMRKQHQGEMAVIAQKMKDDMKNNLAALEDKLRDEYENKEKIEAEVSGSIFTEQEDMSMDETLCNNLQQNSTMHAPLADNLGAELLQAAHKPVDDLLGEEVDSLKSTVEKLQGKDGNGNYRIAGQFCCVKLMSST